MYAVIFIASISFSVTAFAKNNVSNISMDVLIHNNGSATITQQWTGTFDTGTEVYLPIEDRSLIVSNLKVSMNGREFMAPHECLATNLFDRIWNSNTY